MLNFSNKKKVNYIKKKLGDSVDFSVRELVINGINISYVFLESTASDDKISNFLGKSLSIDIRSKGGFFTNFYKYIKNSIPNSKVSVVTTYDDIFYLLSSGFTVIFVDGYIKGICIETKGVLDRSISLASSEPTLKGPKDSFTENFSANIGLIRKRIKDPRLWITDTIVGQRSKTKVAVAYMNDLADMEKVDMIISKLENINIDAIMDSSYIRELISGDQKSIFPRILYTERPDLVSISLLNGKIAIIVENSPYVLIIPAVFSDFFINAEDYYIKPINASFNRLLRYMAFLIAILVPALYIAISTFDLQITPHLLLISFSIQKQNVPFPTIIEVMILIISYEILKEADTRKPQFMGASISIVGALILGDAAVSAGIISPIVVIVISISAVAGMAFTDSDVINAIRIWRILFMFSACMFGLIGICFMSVIFIGQMCSLNVLGYSYLSPLAPMNFYDLIRSFFRLDQKKTKYRSHYINENLEKMGD